MAGAEMKKVEEEHSPALGIAGGAPATAGRLCRGYSPAGDTPATTVLRSPR